MTFIYLHYYCPKVTLQSTLLFLHQMVERKPVLKVEDEILTPLYSFAKYEFTSTEPGSPPKDLAIVSSGMSKWQSRKTGYGDFGSPLSTLEPRTIVTHDMRLLSWLCLEPSFFQPKRFTLLPVSAGNPSNRRIKHYRDEALLSFYRQSLEDNYHYHIW